MKYASNDSNSRGIYKEQLGKIIELFPQWREERLPPPRVSQSQVSHNHLIVFFLTLNALQYDKVGLASE
jgi:hypothetical protein